MTIAYRSVSTTTGTGTTVSLTAPSGVQRGDVLIAIIAANAAVSALETDPAFTAVEQDSYLGKERTIAFARAPASLGTSEFTLAISVEYVAALFAFSGGVGADPVDVYDTTTATITVGSLILSPALSSPTEDNVERLIFVIGDAAGSTALTHTWYQGTERVDIGTSSRFQLTATTESIATPGATPGIGTPSCSSDSYSATIGEIILKSGTAPTITTVDPDYGPITGGETITITGTGFKDALTEVEIADVACTSVTVVSSTVVTAVTPAGSVGAQTLAVYTDEGSA